LLNSVVIMTGAVVILEVCRVRVSGSGGGSGVLRNSGKALASNPLIWAVVIGLVLSATGAELPLSIELIFAMLGQAAAPSALVAIGLFLAARPVVKLLAAAAIPSLGKLALFPLIVWLLTLYVWAMMAVLMAGMPVGANAFVIAGHYRLRLGDASAAIVLSTASSLVTLSLMLILMANG
jgi:malonate transporter